MRCAVFGIGLIMLLSSCGSSEPTFTFTSYEYFPRETYDVSMQDDKPDYSKSDSWAALPFRADEADALPDPSLTDRQASAEVDVFFIHPTTFAGGAESEQNWNADICDAVLNEKTDLGSIRHQASIFNGCGKVYAPRYRQAHLHSYFSNDTSSAEAALAIAYSDVESSFQYYLDNWNKGRPFIIAGHSQGMTHAGPLIKKFIDGTDLQEQLVAAYLVGLPGRADYFDNIRPCENADETGCWMSWRTYAEGFLPAYHEEEENILCTNPLTWTRDTTEAPYEANSGTVLHDFSIYTALFDAKIHEGVLWVGSPNTFGGFLFEMENYHIADLNIFWKNIRDNSILRSNNYLNSKRLLDIDPSEYSNELSVEVD